MIPCDVELCARKGAFCSNVSSALAWISTPAMRALCKPVGTKYRSLRPVCRINPTSTILFAKTSGGTRPPITSKYE